jgi:asparagine synthase (glutamine-hydrolysing)
MGGISRGLARRAFADVLPREIRTRQVKGGGNPFFQYLVRANMRFLRECLCDGLLVGEGILDREKIAEYLVDEQTFRTIEAPEILLYFTAEVWLQQWTRVRSKAVA